MVLYISQWHTFRVIREAHWPTLDLQSERSFQDWTHSIYFYSSSWASWAGIVVSHTVNGTNTVHLCLWDAALCLHFYTSSHGAVIVCVSLKCKWHHLQVEVTLTGSLKQTKQVSFMYPCNMTGFGKYVCQWRLGWVFCLFFGQREHSCWL